ncbi:hypothetical protein M514_03648 [Trichuris suis]|uniref:Telomere-associated protein Rif1 N-terminal domain-containing protein n=1 Tax=Trichuris suis TaxID=68888 RepID=A0A085N062_9BILA|nr:hypothetical protein M514_03648 [Trichuris suis]
MLNGHSFHSLPTVRKAAEKVAAQIVSDLASSDADVVVKSVDLLYMIVKEQSPLGIFTLDSSTLQLLAAGLLNVIKNSENTVPTVSKAFDCLLDSFMECVWSSVVPQIANVLFKLSVRRGNCRLPIGRVVALIERLSCMQFSECDVESWTCITLFALKLALDCDVSVGKAGLNFMRYLASSKTSFSSEIQFAEAAMLILESSAPLLKVERGLHLIAVCSCLLQCCFSSPTLDGHRLVTSFAKAMLPVFSSSEKRLQIAAFCLWDELVQAMAIAEKEMFRAETVQQLMLPYIQVKFVGRNDRLVKMKSWWNLLLNFREHLEDHFEMVCYPFLKFCLGADDSGAPTADLNIEGNDQDVTVDYLPEVLANFLLTNPSGHFDFPRLAPLPVPCFSKVPTVADHADIILEALLVVAPLCCDGQKDFVTACWVTIFDCVGAASGVIAQERRYALCERCVVQFGHFLHKCQIHTDELTVLLSLLVPRYMHFPLLQLPLVEENHRTVSFVGLYLISIVLCKDRASSVDLVRTRKLKNWLNTNVDEIVKLIILDDRASQLLACFYEEAVMLLADDYCCALYYAWRSIVTSLLGNWDKVEKEATSKLSLWLSYAFKHAPYLNKQVELKCVFNHWRLLLDVCPPNSFEMLCIQLVNMAEFSDNSNLSGQNAIFLHCCTKMLCILVSKLGLHTRGPVNWQSPEVPAKTLRQECGHACLRFYCFLVRAFATELQESNHAISAFDEATLIGLFQFVKDVCLTIRDRNEIIAVLKHLTASVSHLVVISDSFVQFSKRTLREQIYPYVQFCLGTVKRRYHGPYDPAFLRIIAQLLTTLLCHKYVNMRRLGLRFWQQTFRNCPLTLPCLRQLKDALERSSSLSCLSDSSPEIEWSTSATGVSVTPCASRKLSPPLNVKMNCGSVLSKKRSKNAENVSPKRRFVVSGNAHDQLVGIRRQLLPGKELGENSPIFIALPSPTKLPLVARMPRISNGSDAPLSAVSASNEDIFDSNTISTINVGETSLRRSQPSTDTQDVDNICNGQMSSESVVGNGQVPNLPSCASSTSCQDSEIERSSPCNSLHEGSTDDVFSSSSGIVTETISSTTSTIEYGNCNSAAPLFPELIDCAESVDILAPLLTSSVCCAGLRKVFNDCSIHTIGDFARLSSYAVQKFPIKEPKVSLAKSALRRLHTLLTATGVRMSSSDVTLTEDAVHFAAKSSGPSILSSEAIETLRGAIKNASNLLENCQKGQSVVVLLTAAEILESSAKDLIHAVKRHLTLFLLSAIPSELTVLRLRTNNLRVITLLKFISYADPSALNRASLYLRRSYSRGTKNITCNIENFHSDYFLMFV